MDKKDYQRIKKHLITKIWGLISVLLIFLSYNLYSQNADRKKPVEVYFRFSADDLQQLYNIQCVSIDKISNDTVWAYTSKECLNKLNIEVEILTAPSKLVIPNMRKEDQIQDEHDWDYYPTYEAYLELMESFETSYPQLCKLHIIGNSVEEREIVMAQISDDLDQVEAEAGLLYTSTMHGDETVGYILMLRLIEYLLENYGSIDKVTNLVNKLDIWINPLANPDGTYASGNHTVYGATRSNANGVDLNRNYPDPEEGDHPDGNAWQPETIAFLDFAEETHLTMSANIHTGAEVVNYPWDTWSRRHADNDWWIYVSRQYADTVHLYAPGGYFDFKNNGITNGYDWYSTSGNRQDFMNYFHHCREFTLEISDTKLPPAESLPDFWDWNYHSLLNYMEQCLFGIQGTVTDSLSGEPVNAGIYIKDHDIDSSNVLTTGVFGAFYRPVYEGIYNVEVKAKGYHTKIIEQLSIVNEEQINLQIKLSEDEEYGIDDQQSPLTFTNILNSGRIRISSRLNQILKVETFLINGKKCESFTFSNAKSVELDISNYEKGIYLCIVTFSDGKVFSEQFIISGR